MKPDHESFWKSICSDIGCSGIDSKCPGNQNCSIIRKIKIAMKNQIEKEPS